MRKRLMFFVHVFRILRAMFVLWLLRKLTHEESLPLTIYGAHLVKAGDVIILQNFKKEIELGEVTNSFGEQDKIHMRIYRRPK